MYSRRNYKFKVIKGVLCWKNNEMQRFVPVSPEVLTRVILHYEKQLKNGIHIWKQIEGTDFQGKTINREDPLMVALASWMEELNGIFENTEPFNEKERWLNDEYHLN